MKSKHGTYIQKLMTVIIDKEQEEFVRNLSWNELNSIKNNLIEFLEKNKFNEHETKKDPNQQLLFD
mgnify:CR=1 FL=1